MAAGMLENWQNVEVKVCLSSSTQWNLEALNYQQNCAGTVVLPGL